MMVQSKSRYLVRTLKIHTGKNEKGLKGKGYGDAK